MTTARVPRLPLDEAKAAADEAAVPDYMAELSIFQVLLNHPPLARAINDLLATMLWHGGLDPRLRTDHMLQCLDELPREIPVRDEDETDHDNPLLRFVDPGCGDGAAR